MRQCGPRTPAAAAVPTAAAPTPAAAEQQPPESTTTLLDLPADALVELLSRVSSPATVAALLSSCRSLQALRQRPDLEALWLARQRAQRAVALARSEQELQVLLALDGGSLVATQEQQASALVAASGEGWAAAVQQLVRMGVDVNSTGALMAACWEGHAAVCEALLAAGADVLGRGEEQHAPLWEACYRGHVACVEALLRRGEQLQLDVYAGSTGEHGSTCLHAACRGGSAAVCRLLLQRAARLGVAVNALNIEMTALYVACAEGHASCVEVLLELGLPLGLDVNLAVAQDGWTPLHVAINAQRNVVETVKALLLAPGVNVNAVDKDDGKTALHVAADRFFDAGLVPVLVGAGADVNVADKRGWTALHLAADQGNVRMVRELVAVPGIVIDAVSSGDGCTAMQLASEGGFTSHAKICQLLQGIDVGDDDDKDDDDDKGGGDDD